MLNPLFNKAGLDINLFQYLPVGQMPSNFTVYFVLCGSIDYEACLKIVIIISLTVMIMTMAVIKSVIHLDKT